jgi:hypothetical protein
VALSRVGARVVESGPGGQDLPAASPARDTGHGRIETPHPEGRPRQPPGLPRRPPGHQDHPPAAERRYRQDLPPDGLRRHRRTGSGPANLATIRAAIKDAGYLHVPEARRDHSTPPKPSGSTASIRTDADIHGTRRSPDGPQPSVAQMCCATSMQDRQPTASAPICPGRFRRLRTGFLERSGHALRHRLVPEVLCGHRET